jgi:hypothetical protein
MDNILSESPDGHFGRTSLTSPPVPLSVKRRGGTEGGEVYYYRKTNYPLIMFLSIEKSLLGTWRLSLAEG